MTSLERVAHPVVSMAPIDYERRQSLPSEVLKIIFKNMATLGDWNAVSRVCRRWHQAANAVYPEIALKILLQQQNSAPAPAVSWTEGRPIVHRDSKIYGSRYSDVHYVDLADLKIKSTVKPKEEVQYVDAFQDKIFIFTHKAIYKLEDEKLETIVSISANYKFRSFDREYGRAVYSNKESIHIYDIKTNVDYIISCPKGCSLYFDEGVVFYDLGVFLAFKAKTSACLCNFSFIAKNILWERSFSYDNGSMISLASDGNHVAISFRWSTGPFLEVYDVNSGDPLILSRSSDLKNGPMDYSGHKLVIHDQLLFCSYENKLFIWDLPNNKLKSVFKLQNDICNICQFEISKNFVAVNCFQPPDQVTYPISIFDIKTEQVVGTVSEVARFQKFHFSLEKKPCLIQIGDKNTLVFRRYSKEAREKNLNDMGKRFSCSFHNAQT